MRCLHTVCFALEQERSRLDNAVHHLVKSNNDLKEALSTEMDRELKTALEENIVIIAKYRARIAAIDEELSLIKGTPVEHDPVALPVEDELNDSHHNGNGTAPNQEDGMWL
jgi:hypothetical protein